MHTYTTCAGSHVHTRTRCAGSHVRTRTRCAGSHVHTHTRCAGSHVHIHTRCASSHRHTHAHTHHTCRLTHVCTHRMCRLTCAHTRCEHTTSPEGLKFGFQGTEISTCQTGSLAHPPVGGPCWNFRHYLNYNSQHNGFLVIIIPYDSQFCMIQTSWLCPGVPLGSAWHQVPGLLTGEPWVQSSHRHTSALNAFYSSFLFQNVLSY